LYGLTKRPPETRYEPSGVYNVPCSAPRWSRTGRYGQRLRHSERVLCLHRRGDCGVGGMYSRPFTSSACAGSRRGPAGATSSFSLLRGSCSTVVVVLHRRSHSYLSWTTNNRFDFELYAVDQSAIRTKLYAWRSACRGRRTVQSGGFLTMHDRVCYLRSVPTNERANGRTAESTRLVAKLVRVTAWEGSMPTKHSANAARSPV
jgi:hypothetical protein